MKVLCPACSREKPLALALNPRSEAVVCPSCNRRYRTETFVLEKQQSRKEGRRFRYTLLGKKADGITQPISLELDKPIVLQTGDTYTLLSRSGVKLGLADQSANTWITLFSTAKKWPFLNRLALFLSIPLTLLALIQITRLPAFFTEQSPANLLLALALLLPLFVAPAILWTLKETLRGDERDRIIPGYHPEDEDL